MQFDLRKAVRLARTLANDLRFIDREFNVKVVNEPELPLIPQVQSFANHSPGTEIEGLYSEDVRQMF